jgi:hypothetical protein
LCQSKSSKSEEVSEIISHYTGFTALRTTQKNGDHHEKIDLFKHVKQIGTVTFEKKIIRLYVTIQHLPAWGIRCIGHAFIDFFRSFVDYVTDSPLLFVLTNDDCLQVLSTQPAMAIIKGNQIPEGKRGEREGREGKRGSDRIGSDRIGSDRLGSDRLGSFRWVGLVISYSIPFCSPLYCWKL